MSVKIKTRMREEDVKWAWLFWAVLEIAVIGALIYAFA